MASSVRRTAGRGRLALAPLGSRTLFLSLGLLAAAGIFAPLQAQFGNGYSFRREVDLVDAQVVGSHTNFPILVSATLADLRTTVNGGNVENDPNGYDIIFTSDQAGTTQLAHQIERYVPSTGEIVMWVRIESLVATTKIYMFYGNSSISSFQGDVTSNGVTGVWDSNFKNVLHLNEDPSGTAPQMQDATSNNNDGTSQGSMTFADLVDGKMGKGLDLDGVDGAGGDHISVADAASLDGTVDEATWSMWINWDNWGAEQVLIMAIADRFLTGDGYEWAAQAGSPDGNSFAYPWAGNGSNYNLNTATDFTNGTWHYMSVRYDWTSRTLTLNLDGNDLTNSTEGVNITNWTQQSTIDVAWLWGGSPERNTRFIDAQIDEIRVSDVSRSLNWIKTGYNNQDSPSTFYAIGSEEASGAAGGGVTEGLEEMPWINPGNVTADDGAEATITNYDSDEFEQTLRSHTYGFAIPGGATIDGIEVIVRRRNSSGGGGVADDVIRLAKAGVAVGDNKSTGVVWPTSEAPITYGTPTDLWGTTWTPADINDPGFGLTLNPLNTGNAQNAQVDYIQIIVYYTDDTTAPDAVTDLATGTVTASSVDLTWTAPGDDGATGTAATYDIRYSTSTITEGNWASASQATGEPSPQVAGSAEAFTVTGLSASTTYYFAIKTSDEIPNESAISNVPSAATSAPPTPLLARYWMEEASSGQGPTQLLDDQASPLNLPITYDGANYSYTAPATGRGWTSTTNNNQGRATTLVDGTKIQTTLDGATAATIEIVVAIDALNSSWSRLIHIGDNSDSGYFTLSSPNTTTLAFTSLVTNRGQWNPGFDGTRAVFHLVYDSSEPTAGDRVRLYKNGTLLTSTGGTAPPLNETLSIPNGKYFAIANRELCCRSFDGAIYYAAVYDGALTAAEASTKSTALLALDDSGDLVPPDAVADLATGAVTSSTIDLSWTAPGDDAATGTATTYDVRYSTSTITAGNWASATQATGEPSPSVAGSAESFTVAGLLSSTTYYFAIKTSDEVPNESTISNVPSATTLSSAQGLVVSGDNCDMGQDGSSMDDTGSIDLFASDEWGAFCFENLDVPWGSTIVSAVFKVYPFDTSDDSPNVYIDFEQVDSATALALTANNISNRWTETGNKVTWDADNVGTGQVSSPDLSVPLQAIIDRPGWKKGNTLMLLLDQFNSTDLEITGYGEDPAKAARLDIQYTEIPNTPPTVASAIPDTTVNEDNPTINNYRDLNAVFTDAEQGSALSFTSRATAIRAW